MIDTVRARACAPETLSEAVILALREAPALRSHGVREELAVYQRVA